MLVWIKCPRFCNSKFYFHSLRLSRLYISSAGGIQYKIIKIEILIQDKGSIYYVSSVGLGVGLTNILLPFKLFCLLHPIILGMIWYSKGGHLANVANSPINIGPVLQGTGSIDIFNFDRKEVLYIYPAFSLLRRGCEFRGNKPSLCIFNRPGVAGAVLQTPPWLIHSFIDWCFSSRSSQHHYTHSVRARKLKF